MTIKEMPVIQEWYDILREKQETKHLSVILTRYVSGSAAPWVGIPMWTRKTPTL